MTIIVWRRIKNSFETKRMLQPFTTYLTANMKIPYQVDLDVLLPFSELILTTPPLLDDLSMQSLSLWTLYMAHPDPFPKWFS
jgi:hypothetical protein